MEWMILVIVGVWVSGILYTWILGRQIHMKWEMPEVTRKIEESMGKLCVLFKKNIFFGKIKIFVICTNLMTGESVKINQKITIGCKECVELDLALQTGYSGRIRCQVEKVRIYDWSGIIFRTVKMKERVKADMLVLPDITENESQAQLQWQQNFNGIQLVEDKHGYDYSEPPGIREYQIGDSMKSIHWKLTGRLDQLYVKEACVPAEHTVTLFVETVHTECPDDVLCDRLASELFTACTWLTDRDFTYSVIWYHHEKSQFVQIQAGAAEDIRRVLYRFMGCRQIQGEITGREHYEKTQVKVPENLYYIGG